MLVASSQLPVAAQRPQGGIYCLNLNHNPQVQCHQQGNSKCCEKLCCSCCLHAADTLEDHMQCPVWTHRPSDSWSNGIHTPLPNSPSAHLPLVVSTLTNVQPHQATQNDESCYAHFIAFSGCSTQYRYSERREM